MSPPRRRRPGSGPRATPGHDQLREMAAAVPQLCEVRSKLSWSVTTTARLKRRGHTARATNERKNCYGC